MKKRERVVGVFLDRDGTVIQERGYIKSLNQIRLIRGAGEGVKLLNRPGIRVFIVSNQSGVARGLVTMEEVERMNRVVEKRVERAGGRIDGTYFCPHLPKELLGHGEEGCRCRKPETGSIKRAAEEHNLSFEKIYVVGDKVTDLLLAERAGGKGILVLTGYGRRSLKSLEEEPERMIRGYIAVRDILNACRSILKDCGVEEGG